MSFLELDITSRSRRPIIDNRMLSGTLLLSNILGDFRVLIVVLDQGTEGNITF